MHLLLSLAVLVVGVGDVFSVFFDGVEGYGNDEADYFEGRPQCIFYNGSSNSLSEGKGKHAVSFGHRNVIGLAVLELDELGPVDLYIHAGLEQVEDVFGEILYEDLDDDDAADAAD